MRTRNDGDVEGEEKVAEGTGGEDIDADKEGSRQANKIPMQHKYWETPKV